MHQCIVCGRKLEEKDRLLLCRNMPAGAQDIPAKDQLEGEKSMDLQLCQCPACGLVQFDCEPVRYYRDVIRAGGYSTTMTELHRAQYSHLIETYRLEGRKFIEIGCGQGEFLSVLTEFPVEAAGIEHSAALVEKAREKGLNVWRDFAENGDTVLDGGPYDVFLSFNFLEHQPDPNGMLQCIYNNLSEEGYGLVTVPDFGYILRNDAFYELLRDHIANYSADSLRFLLNKNGFEVLEESIINQDTVSMIVKKRSRVDVRGIRSNLEKLTGDLNAYIDAKTARGKKVAVWGASHQGFTAVSTTGIRDRIEYIVDSAPFKQGRYAPASHVPIVSPETFFSDPADCVIIMAPGYAEEISRIIRSRCGSSVEVSVVSLGSFRLL